MRRTVHLTATCAALTALLLTGCSGQDPDSSPTGTAPGASQNTSAPPSEAPPLEAPPTVAPPTGGSDDAAALATVVVSGPPGKMPFFNVESPITLSGPVARVDLQGTGKVIEPLHAVAAHVASFDVKSDTIVGSTYEEGPEMMLIDEAAMPKELMDAMIGVQVGGRVLFGAPEDGETKIWSFEILATEPIMERATGKAVKPEAGLPAIKLSDKGEPTITPAKGDPPNTMVVQPLIENEGDKLTEMSWLVVNYRNWLWNGNEVFSTWESGHPELLRLSDALPGWQEGLVGQALGSQVMLVVPPSKAYGAQGADKVPPNSTLVYVIDILAGM